MEKLICANGHVPVTRDIKLLYMYFNKFKDSPFRYPKIGSDKSGVLTQISGNHLPFFFRFKTCSEIIYYDENGSECAFKGFNSKRLAPKIPIIFFFNNKSNYTRALINIDNEEELYAIDLKTKRVEVCNPNILNERRIVLINQKEAQVQGVLYQL